jgi:hypothetical protein
MMMRESHEQTKRGLPIGVMRSGVDAAIVRALLHHAGRLEANESEDVLRQASELDPNEPFPG